MLAGAARFIQLSLRDGMTSYAMWPTINAVLAVSTPLDVLFNGAIITIVLQLDSLQMRTRLTHTEQLHVATQFSVVITQQQEQALRRQLSASF